MSKSIDTRLNDLDVATLGQDKHGVVALWSSPLQDGPPGYWDNPDLQGDPLTPEAIERLKVNYRDVIYVDYVTGAIGQPSGEILFPGE